MQPGTYRYVASHPSDLATGATVSFGDVVELNDEALQQPGNTQLIESGALIEVPASDSSSDEPKKARSRRQSRPESGGSNESSEEETP